MFQKTDYGLGGRGSIPRRGKKYLSTPKRPDRLQDPFSLLSNGYRGLFALEVKRQGLEADHSLSSSAEVNNVVLYLHSFMSLHGVLLN
jgi:hypothetical protein